jgi:hypothetical protein
MNRIHHLPVLIALTLISAITASSQSNIPPNFGAYTLNPLYDSTATLGWAEQRIVEKLDRGLVAVRQGESSVYLAGGC